MKLIFKYVTNSRELVIGDVDGIKNCGHAYVHPFGADGLWTCETWKTLANGSGSKYGPPTGATHHAVKPTIMTPHGSPLIGQLWRLDFETENRHQYVLGNHFEPGHNSAGLFIMNEHGTTISKHTRNVNQTTIDGLMQAYEEAAKRKPSRDNAA